MVVHHWSDDGMVRYHCTFTSLSGNKRQMKRKSIYMCLRVVILFTSISGAPGQMEYRGYLGASLSSLNCIVSIFRKYFHPKQSKALRNHFWPVCTVYLCKLQIVFVLIAKYICFNCQMYLSKLQKVVC